MKIGFLRKSFMVFMCCMMLVQQHQAFAQAQAVAPVANFVVNRAIAASLTRVAIARGFAANDARIAATMVGVGTSMTAVNVVATVGGVALAVAGAPVWLTVVGGLGILAVGAAIVAGTTSLAVDAGKVTVTGSTPASPPAYVPPAASIQNALGNPSGPTANPIIDALLRDGTKIYRTDQCVSPQACMQFPLEASVGTTWVAKRIQLCGTGACAGGDMIALYFSEQEFIAHIFDGAYWSFPANGDGTGRTIRSTKVWASGQPANRTVNANGTITIGGSYAYNQVCKIWNGSSGSACPAGYDMEYNDTWWTSNYATTITVKAPAAGSGTQQYASLDAAVEAMSTADKAQAISSDALAKVVNKAWANAAAQPNYAGLPYSATSPVTAAEVQAWQFENPALNPTLGDLLVPAVAVGATTVPISVDAGTASTPNPNPTPDPNPPPTPVGTTNVNVVNVPTVRVDWGGDPGVGAPSMEQTPTASAILSPLLNLMPSLRSFVVPSHASVCPKPSFSVFERHIVMDTHCAVLDDAKPTLYAVMAFVWLMLGTLIVLKA